MNIKYKKQKYVDCKLCPWFFIDGFKSCDGKLHSSYNKRIERLERWLIKLKEMINENNTG